MQANNNLLLTIIIPAYNMEKLLHRCLDSIIVESVMDKVQVIVVNDGSKDKTLEIAYEYENRYPHYIQVVDKENGNYGSCMNVGLSLADGKYFRTLDADDWYDSSSFVSFVEDLMNTDSDMIVSEYFKKYEGTGREEVFHFDKEMKLSHDIPVTRELWRIDSVMSHMHVYCVTYKTSILKAAGLKWSEKVFYTDNEYLYWPLEHVRSIRFIPYPVYIYQVGRGEQSVSLHSLKKNFHSYDVVTNKVLDHYLKLNHQSEVDPLARYFLKKLLCRFYNTLMYNGLDNKESIIKLEKKLKTDNTLYEESAKVSDFRGHYFIDYFRNNRLKFYMFRFDYLLRTNETLRNLFKR